MSDESWSGWVEVGTVGVEGREEMEGGGGRGEGEEGREEVGGGGREEVSGEGEEGREEVEGRG